MKPSEVTKGHVERHLWWHLYKPTESYEKLHQISRVPFAYKKGDKVCISHMVKTFKRVYDEKWTREIFKVVQSFKCFGIHKYRLCDLDGEDIKGTFYKAVIPPYIATTIKPQLYPTPSLSTEHAH